VNTCLKPPCGILSAIHEQSADINQGVDRANPEDHISTE
jgi:S-adenosylmethionine synthetase